MINETFQSPKYYAEPHTLKKYIDKILIFLVVPKIMVLGFVSNNCFLIVIVKKKKKKVFKFTLINLKKNI